MIILYDVKGKQMVRESNEVLERIGENRTHNNVLRRKANWIGHVLRRNCLLHDAIDYLRNRIRYWELTEAGEDRKRWKR